MEQDYLRFEDLVRGSLIRDPGATECHRTDSVDHADLPMSVHVPRRKTRCDRGGAAVAYPHPVEWLIGPLAAGAGIVLSVNRPGETARSAPKR
jgi:hypothetical protein